MTRLRNALLGLVAAALLMPSAAEAARITVTNGAGIIVRVKWKVEDSESGWTTLVLGDTVYRDYPDDYPTVRVTIEANQIFTWTDLCHFNVNPAKSRNIEIKGTVLSVDCHSH